MRPDYPIGTKLSKDVLQRRRDRDELAAPPLNVLHQRVQPCVFSAYASDRPGIVDGFQGERKYWPITAKGK